MENIQEGSHLFSNCADKVNPAEYTPLPLHCTVTLRLLFGILVIVHFKILENIHTICTIVHRY